MRFVRVMVKHVGKTITKYSGEDLLLDGMVFDGVCSSDSSGSSFSTFLKIEQLVFHIYLSKNEIVDEFEIIKEYDLVEQDSDAIKVKRDDSDILEDLINTQEELELAKGIIKDLSKMI